MPGSALEDVLRRAADGSFVRWQEQARSAGWCSRPVRLSGSTDAIDAATGELRPVFSTAGEPDGVLLKACGCRRETVCPTCAATYRADAYQLVAAGLRGGKGVPESVGSHPALFVTLTAPGFGPVHTRRQRNGFPAACHRRQTCAHGTPLGCPVRHPDNDDRLGEPVCVECFDYEAAVLWNSAASDLWRRTTIYTRRALAASAGVTVRELRSRARLSYTKVVEYQRRGVIHVHAVIRIDGPEGPATPPDPVLTVDLLAQAVRSAAARVAVPLPVERDGVPMIARWGTQIDVRPIAGTEALPGGAVAAYIAKYATKSSDGGLGQLDHRLTAGDLDRLHLRPHLHRLVITAWDFGGRPELAHLRLREWAHTLGYRGHWMTKSRRYSTTLGALRAARHQWRNDQAGPHQDDVSSVRRKDWRYTGRGYTTPGDAWLAQSAAKEQQEARAVARLETRTTTA